MSSNQTNFILFIFKYFEWMQSIIVSFLWYFNNSSFFRSNMFMRMGNDLQ